MDRHHRLLHLTLKHAAENPHDTKMAAIVAIGSKPISKGYNQVKSHPKQKCLFNPRRLLHAELAAIIGCNLDALVGATIYVARRYMNGMPALAKPCPMCHEILLAVGIKRVYYTIGGTPENIEFGTYRVGYSKGGGDAYRDQTTVRND